MPDDIQTDANNTDGAEGTDFGTAGPRDSSSFAADDGDDAIEYEDGLIPTVELVSEKKMSQDAASTDKGGDDPTKAAKPTDEDPDTKKTGTKTEAEPKSGFTVLDPEGNKVDFDKVPRFQELETQITTLKGQLETLGQLVGGSGKGGGQGAGGDGGEPEYTDVNDLDIDEVRRWIEEDPIGYSANLARQIKAELRSEGNQAALEQRIDQTFIEFEKENPEFRKQWDSGKLRTFMNKNPGHNAISAFVTLNKEKMIGEAVEKARKEERAKVIQEFKVKGHAAGLGSTDSAGQRPQSSGSDAMLKDPDKYGGEDAVLVSRFKSRQRRQMMGAGA